MRLIIQFLLFSLLLSCGQNPTVEPSLKLDQGALKKIDSLFAAYDSPNTPGYAIGIVKDSLVLFKGGYGMANLDYSIPIGPNTAFDIASVSKQFTGACIALLIQENKLKLNSPASHYFPELAKFEDTIRIKHLLYNTSGLKDYLKLPREDNQSWIDLYYFDIDDALEATLSQEELSFKPGEKWDYSNANFMMLARIVEVVSGQSLGAFLNDRIFEPLWMKHTLVNDDITAIVKNRATPYNLRSELYVNAYRAEGINISSEGEWIRHPRISPHYGGSGIISTVEDLILWEQNFFSHQLGGTEFYDIMHQTMDFEHGRNNQAFGLYFGNYRERKFVAWEGATYGISAQVIRFPDEKVALIVLSNHGDGASDAKAYQLADVLIEDSLL